MIQADVRPFTTMINLVHALRRPANTFRTVDGVTGIVKIHVSNLVVAHREGLALESIQHFTKGPGRRG